MIKKMGATDMAPITSNLKFNVYEKFNFPLQK